MLAPDTFNAADGDAAAVSERSAGQTSHPHRRLPAIEHRRRLGPPQPEQPCIAPLTLAGRTRERARRASADAPASHR